MELYSYGLVARLLSNWPELKKGYYPYDPGVLVGYRGQHRTEAAPFEPAIIAAADLDLAAGRLSVRLRWAIYKRFLGGKQTEPSASPSAAHRPPRPAVVVDEPAGA